MTLSKSSLKITTAIGSIQIKNEKYYQTIFYAIFMMLGLKVKDEIETNIGRIDAVTTDITSTAEDADFVFNLMEAGAAVS